MATPLSYMQRMQVAETARKRFVADAGRAMVDLTGAVQDRLTAYMDEAAPSRERQSRRDTWMLYQQVRGAWLDTTMKVWQDALKPPSTDKKKKEELSLDDVGGLSLVGTDEVENKILSSRLVMAVAEKVSIELDDVRVRIKFLESRDELQGHDILRPEVLILLMVEQWSKIGMPRDSWPMVNEVVQKVLIEKLKAAYASCNEFLVQQGVMPTIDLKDRVKRPVTAPSRPRAPAAPRVPEPGPEAPEQAGDGGGGGGGGSWAATAYSGELGAHPSNFGQVAPQTGPGGMGGMPVAQAPQATSPAAASRPGRGTAGLFGGRLGWEDAGAVTPRAAGFAQVASGGARGSAPAVAGAGGQTPAQIHHAMAAQGSASNFGGAHEETRLMTHTTPLARTRSHAQGMFGQLKRMLVGQGAGDFTATAPQPPSPALVAAMAERPSAAGSMGGAGGHVADDFSPAGVVRVAGKLREKTDELKKKAETKSEKAIIEIVALMFQAILTEDRIPPAIRVWFARLQMPVLRVALAEPEFFGTMNHPARQLIDRMGSCVMGFDASGISGSAMEIEIKRIVQVIEQYPETGKRVFQIVYDEFQKFLTKFLTGKEKTQKVVSVAQQVEQKETLTIQYTIELRNLLKELPVRDEIRTFLFKVWAEVLAVSAVRKGPKDAETVALKKAAADMVWSASAKPNRNDRARVIQDLPQLLQRLRAGMGLLGMPQGDQDAHIKIISDTMADAFMSKTQAIPQAQIDAMTQRLANLEDFVSEDGLGDLPLDAESIEMMLGIDASSINVVTNGGSKPTPAMVAWAQELQPGAWFTLDHNGRVAKVQYVWRSDRKHLNLFASSEGHSYLIQAGRLAAYLQAGLLLPQEEETLTVRATREALTKLEANPERLVS